MSATVHPRPATRFATTPSGTSIAYQCFGDAGIPIVSVPPMAQNIEMAWEWPAIRRMFEGFASFSRFIPFDKRGTGMSDRSLNIPRLDERIDELSAVLDHAGIDQAYIMGTSEGGPMALLFAATYPQRTLGVILESSAASLAPPDEAGPYQLAEKAAAWAAFVTGWGTPSSITVDRFAPSLAADPEFRLWHQRYERNAASRDAIGALVELGREMDARGVLHRIECPVLILHRIGDRVVPIEVARETEGLLRSHGVEVQFVEMPGPDHFLYAADLEMALRAIEQFATGREANHSPGWLGSPSTIGTMGGFEVHLDGMPVASAEWGSRRARTLLKRLVAARGSAVTRDELFELLWPDESDPSRLGPRLSVQLSAVRRVLHGGVIADRSTVRLDLAQVNVDIERWFRSSDDAGIVAGYTGEFLPDDRYEDWTRHLRDEIRTRFVAACHRLAASTAGSETIGILRRVLAEDPYDSTAHQSLIRALRADEQFGQARAAYQAYVAAMEDLSVPAVSWDDISR